jgi:hypothetical protein
LRCAVRSQFESAAARVAIAQGAYYTAAGAWPIVSYRSFELVTGPKREPWLVKMVGLLAAAIGASLCSSVVNGSADRQRTLGISSALAFAIVDVWYAVRGRIRPIYLADAGVEAGIIAAWVVSAAREESRRERPPRERPPLGSSGS